VATRVPRTARLDLPKWFWGGDIPGFFVIARLRAKHNATTGDVTVEAEEHFGQNSPPLVRAAEFAGPTVAQPQPFMSELEMEALGGLGRAELLDQATLQTHLEQLLARVTGPSTNLTSLAAGFGAHQLQTLAARGDELDATVLALLNDIRAISVAETGKPAFPGAGAYFVSRQPALLHRMKLAPVLLRIEHDDALKNADMRKVAEANARGELIFAASGGISDGVVTLDAYLAPLMGALTPFVWVFPATRASGTVLYALGSQIAGTESGAAEPLQLLPGRGADSSVTKPALTTRSAGAAIAWWAKRLDKLFGVLSDPAVFTDEQGVYVPSKHLHAQLSVEQLFRRTASIQRAHRDTDAGRVLLFTTLDTLERLTSRTLTQMCMLSEARRVLSGVRDQLSRDVAQLLLPAAERAVNALESVQAGFYLSSQQGRDQIHFVESDGTLVQLPLEEAAAEYLRAMRNATHGHGSDRPEAKSRTDALLTHHNGSFAHDLALLGYVYLLDLMCHTDKLKRRLWNAGAV